MFEASHFSISLNGKLNLVILIDKIFFLFYLFIQPDRGGTPLSEHLSFRNTPQIEHFFVQLEIHKLTITKKSTDSPCSKRVNISEKSCMTGKIRIDWLESLNGQRKSKNSFFIQTIVPTLHNETILSNVKTQFYLPNCTKKLQPSEHFRCDGLEVFRQRGSTIQII